MKRSERQEIVRDVIEPYLTAKRDRSMKNQYERIKPDPNDQRIRTVMSFFTTETGRAASSESFVDYSTNLQNLAKEVSFKDELYRIRDCFIAPPGWKLVACDYEKAEAVIVAAESRDWDFLDMILHGHDIHDFHAEKIWGPDFTKDQRHVGKRVTYSSFYLASVKTITRKINAKLEDMRVTEEQVEKIHSELMDIHPLEDWWDQVWENLEDPDTYGGPRWLEDCLGFRRKFYNPNEYDRWKEAVNFKAQSGVASIIDRAMINSFEELDDDVRARFVLQVHDELLWLVKDPYVETFLSKIKPIMEKPFEIHGRELYIPIEAEVGDRWDGWRGPEGPDPENEMGRLKEVEI